MTEFPTRYTSGASADSSVVPGGGVIRKLESLDFSTDDGDIERAGVTEAPVSDYACSELCDLGLTPICLDASSSLAVVYEIYGRLHRIQTGRVGDLRSFLLSKNSS